MNCFSTAHVQVVPNNHCQVDKQNNNKALALFWFIAIWWATYSFMSTIQFCLTLFACSRSSFNFSFEKNGIYLCLFYFSIQLTTLWSYLLLRGLVASWGETAFPFHPEALTVMVNTLSLIWLLFWAHFSGLFSKSMAVFGSWYSPVLTHQTENWSVGRRWHNMKTVIANVLADGPSVCVGRKIMQCQYWINPSFHLREG